MFQLELVTAEDDYDIDIVADTIIMMSERQHHQLSLI